MATIEVPDELVDGAQQIADGLAQGAPGTAIPMPDPMAVAPEDEQKALDSSAALEGVTRQAVPGLSELGIETDPFKAALAATDAQLQEKLQAGSDAAQASMSGGQKELDMVNRVGLGVLQAGDQTVRFFGDMIGNPDIGLGGVSDAINRDAAELDRRSGVNGFLGGTAQFVTGLVGLGKLTQLSKAGRIITGGRVIAGGGVGIAQGAIAAAVVMDPHSARLSDLVQQYPALQNPITEYLASDPTDSAIEGRFKNALEGAGMDVAVAGIFGAAIKVFSMGKAVEAGTLPQQSLDQATAELDKLVQEAKSPGSTLAAPQDPAQMTLGGSPAQVLPEAPNLLTPAQANEFPTEQSVIDAANGLGAPRDPEAGAIAEQIAPELNGKLPTPKPSILSTEAKPQVKPEAGSSAIADSINKGVAPKTGVGAALVDEAKAAGIPIKRQAGAAEMERSLAAKPKIETNGIKYAIITPEEMTSVGKANGFDSSNWLGAGHRDTGEIYISQKVLDLPPAQQARIISHETGHVLEKQFVEKVTGTKGDFRILSKSIRDEMAAASQLMRKENWDALRKYTAQAKAGSKTAAKEANKVGAYLNSEKELFADSFAVWKTDRAEFGRVAPQMSKLFDEHFQPWIDHDFTAHMGDLDAATKGVSPKVDASQEALTGAPAPKAGVYGDKVKAERTVEQYTPEARVSVDDAAEVARVAGNDAAAIAQHGTQEAAEKAGYRFGKANIPYQKLNTSEDVSAFIGQTAARFKAQLDEMKDGAVLSDPRVEAAIKQRVELFNEDPSVVMGQLQAAGRNANAMVANMEAAFTVANKAANDLEQLVKNNRLGNYAEFGGDANAAEAALAPRLALYLEALGSAQAMRSALGRGMRRLRGDFILDEKTINNVRKLLPEDVQRIVDMAAGDKRLLAKTAQQGYWDRFTRGASSLFANNLLWGWPSHVRNLIGNVYMLGSTPAIRTVGSFGVKGGHTVRQQAMREYRYMMSSVSDAAHMAVQAYLKGDSALDPYGNEFFREAASGQPKMGAAGKVKEAIGLVPVNSVADAWTNLSKALVFMTGQPTRVLGMADEFFKQTSYRGSVLAEASMKADELGLEGADFSNYLKSQLDASFDAQGRAINKDALYDAEVKTFSQPLLPGTMGKSTSTFVNAHPMTRFVLPFVRTPANLFRYAVKLTPGLNLLQKEYRQMLKGELGPKRQADAYGQFATGGLLAAIGVNMGLNGLITGGGPTDPARLSALQATGWKPYSVLTGMDADGRKTYVPINNMDPIGQTLSLMADLAQVANMGVQSDVEFDKLVLPVGIAMATNLANRTYMKSLNDFFDAAGNPDASMAQWAGGVASGMVPFSSALRQSNPDPYLREARGIMDRVLAGIPGFSDDLPMKRDYAGEPIMRTSGLVFKDAGTELADQEQQRMLVDYGSGIVALSAVTKAGVDLRAFRLAETGKPAFDRYQEIASHPEGAELSMKEALGQLIQSDNYRRLSDGDSQPGTKLHALQNIVQKYREQAYRQLLQENPDLRAETAMKQQALREALTTGKPVGVAGQLRAANAAFGIQTQ